MAKSYRSVFIRVTSENNTDNGVISYSKDDINNILLEWAVSASITYWFIEHQADSEVSKTHYHIVIKFPYPTPFENIKSKFPYGDIESAKNVRKCVQYLIHFNDRSKVQYKWDDVVTNCVDMSPFKVQSSSQNEITLQYIIDEINLGHIREYNQFDMIPIEIWSKNKSRIENALLYYRERICMNKNRHIEVIFISGDTGTGKTTFAKFYCRNASKSFCVSSSSNDPMQDYKGEDVLILDDLRDSDFSFNDLLKVLDNHTKSTVRSRYHNKSFIGDTIIITSYRPLSDWYFSETKESKVQLYRRIPTQFKMYNDKIEAYAWDIKTLKYKYLYTTSNTITMDRETSVDMAMKVADVMGFQPIDGLKEDVKQQLLDGLRQISDEEWNTRFEK